MTTTLIKTKRDRVLEVLERATGPMTAVQIAEELDLPRSSDSVGQTLRDLEAAGAARAIGKKRSVGARRWVCVK